jgi:UDP-GlcNAc:undecaprenyl-phosphate GlcNAc-1-phosphate transferase
MVALDLWILPLALTFLLVMCSIWALSRMAPALGLIDRPGGRKQHAMPTPLVGGIAIAFALTLVWAFFPDIRPRHALIYGFFLLVLLGVLDDRKPVPSRLKFLIQAGVAGFVVALGDLGLSSLGELLPGWEPHLLWMAFPLSVFALMSVVNAFNMCDGVDGLAGSLKLVGSLSLAVAAVIVGDLKVALSLFALSAALLGFLSFNAPWADQRARVFLGDAGSMGVALLIACFALVLTSPQEGTVVPPVVALWVCALPLWDGLSVLLRRRSRGVSMMQPGRDHLHHLLQARGWGAGGVVVIEAGSCLAFSVAAIVFWQLHVPDWVLVWMFVISFAIFHVWQKRSWLAMSSRAGARYQSPSSPVSVEAGPVSSYPLAVQKIGDELTRLP